MGGLARTARPGAGPLREAAAGGPRRCRGRGAGGVRPLLAVAAPGGRPVGVSLHLREAYRAGLAADARAAVPAGEARGPAGGRSLLRRPGGTGRTEGGRRGGLARPARRPARGARDEDLGRPVVPPDRRGARDLAEHRRVPLSLRSGQAACPVGGGADPMNEPDDPLEAELSTLRPLEISPALRRRVAA